MNYAIIIPAQESNKYHKLGDLAPFGDTTLLEWKISQCKEFTKNSQIYISSNSEIIKNIALKEEVSFIQRDEKFDYKDMVNNTIEQIDAEIIIWINTTSPFMSSIIYKNMYEKLKNSNSLSIVSVEKKKEYLFYKNKKLNFSKDFISREAIEPIYIMTNGCYITYKDEVLKNSHLVGADPLLYEVDSFVSTEIKDINDYSIAKDLIFIYFKKECDV
jgi:CMP-N-acetylneuraminic acid synthetase